MTDEIKLVLTKREAKILIEALEMADQRSLRSIWLPLAAQITTAIDLKLAEDLRVAKARPPPESYGGSA